MWLHAAAHAEHSPGTHLRSSASSSERGGGSLGGGAAALRLRSTPAVKRMKWRQSVIMLAVMLPEPVS